MKVNTMRLFHDGLFLENSMQSWLIALGLFVALAITITVFRSIVVNRLKKWTLKTKTTLDDFAVSIIERSVIPLLYIVAFYASVNTLTTAPAFDRVLRIAFLFASTFFVLRAVSAVVRQFVFSFIKYEDSEAKAKQAKGLLVIVNVTIWILGLVFLIDNLGYDVTTLITGLGIGGIAIALAAQAILGDLFSYFVIFFDRPFEIGDFIIVDDKMGTIEYVGVKTTRIRTLSGEQLICSNTFLTNAQVHNYKRMEQRRVVFKIGVTYQTPKEKLQQIPEMVNSIIRDTSEVRLDRGHFSEFGDFSLNFEFVYYVLSSDYTIYMNKQQSIYLGIVAAFESENIEFAYPTQTLFVQQLQQQTTAA